MQIADLQYKWVPNEFRRYNVTMDRELLSEDGSLRAEADGLGFRGVAGLQSLCSRAHFEVWVGQSPGPERVSSPTGHPDYDTVVSVVVERRGEQGRRDAELVTTVVFHTTAGGRVEPRGLYRPDFEGSTLTVWSAGGESTVFEGNLADYVPFRPFLPRLRERIVWDLAWSAVEAAIA